MAARSIYAPMPIGVICGPASDPEHKFLDDRPVMILAERYAVTTRIIPKPAFDQNKENG